MAEGRGRLRPRCGASVQLKSAEPRPSPVAPPGRSRRGPDFEVGVVKCRDQGLLGLVPAYSGQGTHRGGPDFRGAVADAGDNGGNRIANLQVAN